jgi:hypothetical protein
MYAAEQQVAQKQEQIYQKKQADADADRGSANQFAVMPGWEAIEKNAKGQVTTYRDKAGNYHYTPDNYKFYKLGWTESEALKPGDNPKEGYFVGTENYGGKFQIDMSKAGVPFGNIMLTQAQYDKFLSLKDNPNAQVDYGESLGLYPHGSEMVETGGKQYILTREQANEWTASNKTRREWETSLKNTNPELYQVYKGNVLKNKSYAAGYKAVEKEVARQQTIYLNSIAELETYLKSDDAPNDLSDIYFNTKSKGGQDRAIRAYDLAARVFNEKLNRASDTLKDGNYIDDKGNINHYKYLQDISDVKRGLSTNLAYERLATDPKIRDMNVIEYGDYVQKEAKKIESEMSAETYESRIKVLQDAGVSDEAIKEALYYAKLGPGQKIWQGMTPWEEYKGEKANVKGVAQMSADTLLPGFYVARSWKELSNGERGLYIAIDALSLALPALAVVKAAGAGARAVGLASRSARLLGALKAGSATALREVIGPVDIILHPIGSAKITQKWLRSAKEIFTDPRRVSEAVISTSSGQIMFRASDFGTIERAAKASDMLMERVAKGEKLYVDVAGVRAELKPGALMKETGGMSHATTDLTEFEKGLTVEYQAGKPIKEQGLFLSSEPVTDYILQSASGKGAIPIPTQAGGKAEKVWYYKDKDIARMDADVIKPVTFKHAKKMPRELAGDIEAIVKKYDGRLSGSFNTYIKVPGAKRPNDIDAVFKTPETGRKAQAEIIEAAKKKGYDALPGTTKRDVQISIKNKNKYESIIDCDDIAHHNGMIPAEYVQPTRVTDGFNIETLGEQYIRQSYGSVAGSNMPQRVKSVDKMAKVMEKLLIEDGATVRKPGIVIFSEEAAQEAVPTEKLFYALASDYGLVEVESKFKPGKQTKKAVQSLWFRTGPRGIRAEVILEKPLKMETVLKLKAIGLLEDLKAPFRPAIVLSKSPVDDLSRMAEGLNQGEIKQLVRALRRGGHITEKQGANILRAGRIVTAAASAKDLKFIDRTKAKTTADGTSKARAVTIRAPAQGTTVVRRPPLFAELRGRGITERAAEREIITRAQQRERVDSQGRPLSRESATLTRANLDRLDTPDRAETTRGEASRALPRGTAREPAERTEQDVTRGTTDRLTTERVLPPRTTPVKVPPSRTLLRTPRVPPVPPKEGTLTGKGKTDKEKREIIRKASGSTTYNMGKLHGKDVWWTHLDTGETYVVLGPKPDGATLLADGPGSTYKTTQRLGNKAGFEPYTIKHGAVMSRVTPAKNHQRAQNAFTPVRNMRIGKMYVADVGGGAIGFSRKPIKGGRRK